MNRASLPAYEREVRVRGSAEVSSAIIYTDSFEEVLQWEGGGTGSDYVIDIQSGRVLTGAYAMFLQTKSTPAANDYVRAYKDFYVPISERVRLEVNFAAKDMSVISTIEFTMEYTAGASAEYDRFHVRYSTTNNRWEYYNSSGVWTAISGMTQYFFGAAWNKLELDIDIENTEYSQIRCNQLTVDMDDIASYNASSGSGTGERFRIEFRVRSNGNARAELSIDSVTLQAI